MLTEDLRDIPRPSLETAARAAQTATSWLQADLTTAGVWTDPQVRAVQTVLDSRPGHAGQLRAVAIWSATTVSARGVELHRTEMSLDQSGDAVTGLID